MLCGRHISNCFLIIAARKTYVLIKGLPLLRALSPLLSRLTSGIQECRPAVISFPLAALRRPKGTQHEARGSTHAADAFRARQTASRRGGARIGGTDRGSGSRGDRLLLPP